MSDKEDSFFDHSYFVINKRIMVHVGGWPFRRDRMAFARRTFYLGVLVNSFMVEFIRFLQYWPNPTNIFRIIPSMFARVLVFIKCVNVLLQPKKMKDLLRHMQHDWENMLDDSERATMHEYGKNGRKMVISYTVFIYTAMSTYIVIPYAPVILDVIMPLNQSRQRKFLFDAEYFVDPDEYYFYIAIHAIVTTAFGITLLVVVDTMYMIYGNHVCAQFAVVCHRLQNTFERSIAAGKDAYPDLTVSVMKHRRAMEFTSYVEASFRISMLLQMMFCVGCLSITGVQVVQNMDDKDEVVRLVTFGSGQLCHLFFLNFPGQRVLNHSNQVFQSAYISRWYEYSVGAQKMLRLILMRSMTPCFFTAGKVCILCMETFLSVVQTTMSYFTVLSSV